jgi:hypothetical protein
VNLLPKGTIKRIHVDQHIIKRNRKENRNDPPLTIQTSKGPIKAHEVCVEGPSVLRHTPNKPLSCGAVIYIETKAVVIYKV